MSTPISLVRRVSVVLFSVAGLIFGSAIGIPTTALAVDVSAGSCVASVNDATGVTVSTDSNGDCILVFATAPTTSTTTSEVATRTWTVPSTVSSVDVFIVGGGGGGGMSTGSVPTGGGGGGGGIVLATAVAVTPSQAVTITTGYGGQGGSCRPGYPGGRSTFGTLIAVGGGYGGGCGPAAGGPGGNAGGAHWGQAQGLSTQATTGTPSNSANIIAYGNSGGKSYPHGTGGDDVSSGGGGGGGATGIGGDATQPGDVNSGIGGNGGAGLANSWRTGLSVVYGSGGGGQGRAVQGVGGTNAGTASGANSRGNPGIDGASETGSGGGAGYRQGGGRSGDGGSGIVVVRYSIPAVPSNSVAPVISGVEQVEKTLTATSGSWTKSPTSYTYQWKRASTSGGAYSNIGVASSSNTYVVTEDDVDKFIKVSVVATNALGSSSAVTSAATNAIIDLPASPAPTFSTRTSTANGFTFTITNYSNLYAYTVTTTSGSVARVGDDVTVTGLSGGASATVTVRVTRSGYLASSAQASGDASPTPTTTTVRSTTTTTLKAAVTIDIQAPVVTVAQGQASIATIAPGTAQSTVAPAAATSSVTSTTIPIVTTTIAVPRSGSPVAASTTTLSPVRQTQNPLVAPKIPSVETGESALDLGGVKEKVAVTRENNQLVITAGELSARLSGMGTNGATSPLDKDGNLQLEPGDIIRINVGGFKPGSKVDVWFFSKPIHLGSTKVGADGTVSGAFTVPPKIEDGSHRIAITAKLDSGKEATFTLGVRIGAIPQTSTLTRILIAIPIMMAIGAGLILPNQVRRRRRRTEG